MRINTGYINRSIKNEGGVWELTDVFKLSLNSIYIVIIYLGIHNQNMSNPKQG